MARLVSRRRVVATVACGLWLPTGWGGPPLARPVAAATPTPAAAVEHRAVVVVDTGTEVKSVCVRFQEASLTGVELLARADVDPVFQPFSGKGAAVCALCGVGCPAGDSCLTCNAEGRFWSYSRAPAGTTSLRVSSAGASSTVVHDGDVEGWKWGLGGTPPFATVEQVCGEAPPPASTTSSAPAVTTTAAGGPATPAPAPAPPPAPPSSTAAAVRATTSSTGRPPSTPAPPQNGLAEGTEDSDRPAADPELGNDAAATTRTSGLAAARRATDRSGEGRAWPGLLLFATVLVGLVGWALRTRRVHGGRRWIDSPESHRRSP